MSWNLPPGVTDAMIDRAFGGGRPQSALSEDVQALLEKSRMISQRTINCILEMIAEDEDEANEPDPDALRDARIDYEFERDR